MSARQRAQVGEKALEDWMAEMGREDTMEVSAVMLASWRERSGGLA